MIHYNVKNSCFFSIHILFFKLVVVIEIDTLDRFFFENSHFLVDPT